MADADKDPKSYFQLAAQWGFAASVCIFLVYFICYEMILPMQAVHTKLVDKVSTVNEQNAETMKVQAENASRQTAILERIDNKIERMPTWTPFTTKE